jgi:hypothetical protein
MTISIELNDANDFPSESTTADESAGRVLAPVIAQRPAASADLPTAPMKPATNALPSAISI